MKTIVKTKAGNELLLDTGKWIITTDRNCKIIDEVGDEFILENKTGQKIKLSQSLIYDNNIQITDKMVELSETVYEINFLKGIRQQENVLFNDLFEKNIKLIFKNREVVFSKAEYYLLSPACLMSGAYPSGGFTVSLGKLFDSFNAGNPFYYEELSGYKKMYLVNLKGSLLSGVYNATFWSDESEMMISLESGINGPLPRPFSDTYKNYINMVSFPGFVKIDHQHNALNQLINEMNLVGK